MLFHDPPINFHKEGTMISVSPMIPLLIPEETFSKEQKKRGIIRNGNGSKI